MRLARLTEDPILAPLEDHPWERAAVFNCAVVERDGVIHLLYRAMDRPYGGYNERFVSRIGYAASIDGLNFWRFNKPVFQGETAQEHWGVEDPRIVYMDGRYWMTYTAFGGRKDGDFKIALASTENFLHWERHGVLLDESNKNGVLFPEKVGDKYLLLHRRAPNVWLASSPDLKNWQDHRPLLQTIPDSWQETRVGSAGPPLKTPGGWLFFYHAADRNNVYRLGLAILDLEDPTKVLFRTEDPIMEPELPWEREGLVPNVVFSCGAIKWNDEYLVYYSGADQAIGVAKLEGLDI